MKNKYDIIWLDKVDSTNDEARRRINACDNLSVVTALTQTHGRGQRGNSWSSAPGMNLMFSIVLKDLNVRAYDQFVLSEIAALSVTDFLSLHGIKAEIKWPNDIYVRKRKICGILVENSCRGEWLSSSIIGIGLNVNQRNFDVNLPNPTSIVLETEEKDELDLHECLEDFMHLFSRYIGRYLNITGGYMKLRKMYLSLLWRKGDWHAFRDLASDAEFVGKIAGLSDIGHLVVETQEGGLREFAFKEIGYIL